MKPLKIGIVGSGTSGLAAAAFLTRDGHDVTLFERFDSPRPVGAGLLLQPTGLACLARLGLDETALDAGARIDRLYGEDADGSVIFDLAYSNLRPHLFGLGIHRGALFSLLYDEVMRLGVPVRTACEIVDTEIEAGSRHLVDADGGRHGPFDLVVDASGMRSRLRDPHGTVCRNRPFRYGAVWGVCDDPGQAFGGESLQQRYDGAGVMIGMLAIGRRPADGREAVTFFWSLPVASYDQWRQDGLDPWKARVIGYWPELAPFMEQFRTVDDLTFAAYSDTIMKRWHAERIVFIGDSAHCTSPQLGQGANLGLIDALTLSLSLRGAGSLDEALLRHTKARKSHVTFYQLASRWLTPFFQSDSRALAWLRNRSFGLLCRTPYVKTEMLRTLAGIKTGPFGTLDPGDWHERYRLDRQPQPVLSSQPS